MPGLCPSFPALPGEPQPGNIGIVPVFQMLHILQLEQCVRIFWQMHQETAAMTTRIEVAMSAKDVADARRKARALRTRVAGRRSNTKVEVDAGALKSILKVVDAVSVPLTPRRVATHRTKVPAPTTPVAEISPQEAADILQMSRPSVMRLIEKGVLHPRKVLSRNKLSRAEVVAYQIRHSRQQRRALENLVAFSEEHDF
jgi:hypothetical protein